ncbi:phytanoyl-CoA dioxygenase family protein [Sphingomonas sp. HF-S3]|uniref:Phytanoyl-CoA dioxygenase family protein n=1 Tax=Sphingomonas rustica TaxID=3103142 RepID=A0ABV0B9E1_9SPHN
MNAQEISYARDGYAIVPLYDRTTIMAARADIVEQIDRVSRALYLPFEASCPDAPLEERIDRVFARDRSHADLLRRVVCTDAQRGPRLSAIAADPRLIETAQRIGGRALAGSIVRVRASIASFPGHRHAWHSDVVRDDGTACGRVWITAWIPLSDAGPGRGGLEVLPGRRPAPMAQATDRGFEIPEAAIAGLPHIQPECPAGTVLFLDRFTPHRTLPSVAARFALVVWMMAA